MKSKYTIDTSDVKKARKEVKGLAADSEKSFDSITDDLNKVGKAADKNLKKMGNESLSAGKKVSKAGMELQQVGYQVGDFAVQVQGGTNVAVAFGQQFSQLAGVFGPTGALVGAGVAIGTAFVAPLLDARKAAKDVQKAVDDLIASVDRLQNKSLSNLQEEFGKGAEAVKEIRLQVLGLEADLALLDFGKPAEDLADTFKDNFFKQLARAGLPSVFSGMLGADPKEAMYKLGLDPDILGLDFLRQFSDAIAGGDADGAKLYFENILDAINSTGDGVDGLTKEGKEFIVGLEGMVERAYELQNAVSDTADLINDVNKGFSDAEYQTMLHYQAYAESRTAGTKPTKGTTKPKGKKATDAREYAEQLLKQVRLEEMSLGMSQQAQEYAKTLFNLQTRNKKADIKLTEDQMDSYAEQIAAIKATIAVQKKNQAMVQGIADTIENSMTGAFMSMVDGTKSVGDAFKDMARMIVSELFKVLVVQQMVGSYNASTGAASGIVGAIGSAFGGPRANGGPVQSGRSYMVGERGPEIFTPTTAGNITPSSQSGGSGVTVVQNINISTGVQQTVRSEIRSMMPQIADSAKSAVADAKRRGGNYGKAFA